ncbi:hypothetical protein N9D57_03840, partial [bacterium]|nr:hypothetical protein [bacterium]
MSAQEYDFFITVQDDGCVDQDDCLRSVATKQHNLNRGLVCEAFVRKQGDSSCTHASATNYMPCKKYDNFFDASITSTTSMSFATVNGTVEREVYYEILSRCAWLYENGEFVDQSQTPNFASFNHITHTFFLDALCPDRLPEVESAKVRIAGEQASSSMSHLSIGRFFLLSSPKFLSADCSRLDVVKEEVFRDFDVKPNDGMLSFDEVKEALLKHDVDTGYLDYLKNEKQNFAGDSSKSGLTLHDIVTSPVYPVQCQPTSPMPEVAVTHITYPTTNTQDKECASGKENVRLVWDLNYDDVNERDKQCLYVDGYFVSEGEKLSQSETSKQFTDERPSVGGVGSSAMKLVSHVGRPSLTGAEVVENQQSMALSAIMIWFRAGANANGSGKVWTSGTGKFEKSLSVVNKKLVAKFYGARVSTPLVAEDGKNKIFDGEWHHISMALNKKHGFSIFIDGIETNEPTVDNEKMDFPSITSTATICENSLNASALKDFRVYSGIVTALHVKSIFDCGAENDQCQNLIESKPQTRRIYCIVPIFKIHVPDEHFISPCVTGLFYNGAVIDLLPQTVQKGVVFSFHDTALDEEGYEIVRRRTNKDYSVPLSDFETIVLIDSALDLCAKTFKSLTFFDDEAIVNPGDTFEYAILTKYAAVAGDENKIKTITSDSTIYKTPWFAEFEGIVFVGNSGEPVKDVRLCLRLLKSKSSKPVLLSDLVNSTGAANIASFSRVSHSNQLKESTGYRVTDGLYETFTEIKAEEWLKISLNQFSSIETVQLCYNDEQTFTPNFDIRVLDYDDPTNVEGYKGAKCIVATSETDGKVKTSAVSGTTCANFACKGTQVNSFYGQHITVQSNVDASIAEVSVRGEIIECKHTGFTDEDGTTMIQIIDEETVWPKKIYVGVLAYKAVISDPEPEDLFTIHALEKPDALLFILDVEGMEYNQSYDSTLHRTLPSPPPKSDASLSIDIDEFTSDYLGASLVGSFPGDLSDVPRLGGVRYCHSWDKPCNAEGPSGEAIYRLWSTHSNRRGDRIWTFWFKPVPFSTSRTYTTRWLNDWDKTVFWATTNRYIVGWYSEHSNKREDRRFKVKYRYLAQGYTTSGCRWSDANSYDKGKIWTQ